jgi:WD40 repeat protein
MLTRHRRIILASAFLFVFAGLSPAKGAEPDKPRLDSPGEPLPAEAVQRLGSLAFRVGTPWRPAVLSPDGKTIAQYEEWVNSIVLLDSRTGKEVKRFHIPDGCLLLAYSPNGKTIAGMNNKRVQLLDAESGKVQGELEADFSCDSSSISFSPDGQRIAVAGDPNSAGKLSVTVWDANSFKKLHSLEVLHNQQVHVALSGDGKLLATWGVYLKNGERHAEISRTIQLWDTVTGKELKKIVAKSNSISAVALSPSGKELAVADSTGSSIMIWDLAKDKLVQRLAARRNSGDLLCYSPDGEVLVAGTDDGAVQVWETPTYRRLGMAEVENCTVLSVAFLPEKKVLALGLSGNALRLWEAPSGRILSPTEGHTRAITTLQFSPDGKKVLSGGTDGVRVWNAVTGKNERHTLLPVSEVASLHTIPQYVLSPDGRTVVTDAQGFFISRVMDLTTGKQQYGLDEEFGRHSENVGFSADGKMMAVGSTKGDQAGIRVWNLADGREAAPLPAKDGDLSAVALSADGKSVLMASNSFGGSVGVPQTSEVTLWDTTTGKERWTVTRDKEWTMHLAFSPDGALIATAGPTGVHLLEAATGLELRSFENAEDMYLDYLRFSPDGRMVAAGGATLTGETVVGTVRLWETTTARLRVEFTGHRGHVTALAFSPDGCVLASGSDDTTILLWDLTGKRNAAVRAAARPKPDEFDALWKDLNDTDGAKSYRLVQRLAAYPEEAVALVKAKLPPAKVVDAAAIDKMIAQLDHDDFTRREQASKFLGEAGKAAEPALTKALAAQPSSEKKRRLVELLEALKPAGPTLEMVRPTRALEVLERLGTAEARQLLEELAKGDKNAQLTQDAKATLKRLGASMP